MVRIEALIPGFGGYYVDSTHQLVLLMRRDARDRAPQLRSELAKRYSSRSRPLRELFAQVQSAPLREVDYSLSELIAIQERFGRSPSRIPGIVGAGASIHANRVEIGFSDTVHVEEGLRLAAEQLKLPREALVGRVWGPTVLTGNWDDYHVLSRGGIAQRIQGTLNPIPSSASHGYVVRAMSTGTAYFMIPAHQANAWRGANGAVGDSVWQPSRFYNLLGLVEVNTPWLEGGAICGNHPATGDPFDFCAYADVALARFSAFRSGERKIGTSMYEGQNGSWGSQAINNWYPIDSVLPPEAVPIARRGFVHRSGAYSGTVTGTLALPCANVFDARIMWGQTGTSKSLRLECQYRVENAGWAGGDSGGPVFVRDRAGGPYLALGIQTTASGPAVNGACKVSACSYLFSSFDAIQTQLFEAGLGTLNPATVIP